MDLKSQRQIQSDNLWSEKLSRFKAAYFKDILIRYCKDKHIESENPLIFTSACVSQARSIEHYCSIRYMKASYERLVPGDSKYDNPLLMHEIRVKVIWDKNNPHCKDMDDKFFELLWEHFRKANPCVSLRSLLNL